MPKNFKPLAYEVNNVGKHIKSTKKKYLWKFELDNKEYEITLYISKLSGKRKILLNGDIHSTEKRSSSTFGSYPLRIGTHSLLVFEVDDNKFDLRVDNLSFEATYNSQKLTTGYSYDDPFSETKNPYQDDPFKEPPKKPRKESPEYVRRKSPEIPTRVASKTVYKAPEPIKEEPKVVKPPEPKFQPAPLDLFDMPSRPVITSLPDDLFSIPLTSSDPDSSSQSFNPFEESKVSQQSYVPAQKKNIDLFDLDNLHLGDNYSPAVAKKIEEANKPVRIGDNAPNVPMNQLNNPNQNMNGMMAGMMPGMQMPNGMVPGMMMNPMMFNPFMTGMMPNPWMYQQGPK